MTLREVHAQIARLKSENAMLAQRLAESRRRGNVVIAFGQPFDNESSMQRQLRWSHVVENAKK